MVIGWRMTKPHPGGRRQTAVQHRLGSLRARCPQRKAGGAPLLPFPQPQTRSRWMGMRRQQLPEEQN